MTDAGRYGPDNFIDPNGKPVKNTPFEVRQNGVLSTLYSDVARSSTVSNPGMSDTLGNIMFYAEPGYYDLTVGETTLSVAVDTIGGGTGLTNLDVHEIPFPSIGTTPGAWQGNPTWSDGGPNIEGDWTGQDSNTFAVPFKGLSPISAVSVWGNGFTCALTGSLLANSDVDPTLTILTLAEWSRPTSDWTLSDCDAFQARWAYMDEDEIWHVVRTDVNIVGQLDSAGALTIPGGWPDSPPEEATSVILDFGVSVWLPDGSFALPVGFSHRSQVTTFGSDDIVSSSTGTILCNGCTELTLDDSIVPYQEGMVIFILTSGDSVDLLAGSGSPLIDKNNDAQSTITLASNSRAILQRVEGAWTLIVDGVGAGGVGAQLDEENTWTALQRFLTNLPRTPFADIGTTEPTTMVIAEDEHGEIASFVATAVDFGGGPGPVYVSCGMRVSERDTNGDPTGNYSYFMFSSATQSWSLSVTDGTTILDLFEAASGGHLSELAVGEATNSTSAIPKSMLDAVVESLEEAINAEVGADQITFTGTGLLFTPTTAHVKAALYTLEGILDRSTAVNAISVAPVDLSLYVGQIVASQPTLSFETVPTADGLFAIIGQTDPHENGLYHLDEDGGWVQEHYPNVLIGPQYKIILNDANSVADGRTWRYLTTDTNFWQRANGITDVLGEVNEDLSTEEQTVWWPVAGRWVSNIPHGMVNSDGGPVSGYEQIIRVTDNGDFTLPTLSEADHGTLLWFFVASAGATLSSVYVPGTGVVTDYALTDETSVLLYYYGYGGGYWTVAVDTADFGSAGPSAGRDSSQYLDAQTVSGTHTLSTNDGTIICTGATDITLPSMATIDPDNVGGHEYTIVTGGFFTVNLAPTIGTGLSNPVGSSINPYTVTTPTVLRVLQTGSSWIVMYDSSILMSGLDETDVQDLIDTTVSGLTATDVGADAAGSASAAQAAAIAASQPVDSDLTAIAALATTSYGRALLELADAAAGRTALGLGSAATTSSSDYPPTSRTIAAGTGLTGGGSLAADRTLAVSYGLTASTAVEGVALPHSIWRTGSYYTTGILFSNASAIMASGVVRAMPFYSPVAGRSIDQLALDVHTASGSPSAVLYVMLDDGTGYPGTVVASGTLSTPTTGTRGTTSVSYTLPRGLLWLVAHSTAATWGGLTLAGPSIYLPHQATYTANPINCWSVSGAGTSTLTSFPGGATQSASGLQIMMRAV